MMRVVGTEYTKVAKWVWLLADCLADHLGQWKVEYLVVRMVQL